jgi:hypothetical protein
MENQIIAHPTIQWVYSSKDGDLNGNVGSAKKGDPFPQPVSGDYVFTKIPSLSSN